MKKLSEIKTGEKFEYQGRYYMGMEATDGDGNDGVLSIDLETGLTSEHNMMPDTLVRPVELDLMVEAIKVLKYEEGDCLVLESTGRLSMEACNRLKEAVEEHYGLKALMLDDGIKLSAILRKNRS